jgi:uncharacterized protein (TIGR02246 family)
LTNRFAFLASMTLATASPFAAQAAGPDTQALEAQWARAFNAGDIDHVVELYAADAWLVIPGAAPVKGKAAIKVALAQMAGHVTKMDLRTQSVQALGAGVLVENGVASCDADDGAANPKRSNYQVIWKRDRQGHWRIVRDVVSPL